MAIQFNPFVPSQRTGGPIFNPSFPFLSSTNECAPVSIYDAVGNLLQRVPSGGSYYVNQGDYFDLILNIPAGGVLYDNIPMHFKGTITIPSLPTNVASFELRVLTGSTWVTYLSSSLPIAAPVLNKDVVSIQVVPVNATLPISFVAKIAYDYDSITETTVITGGTGQYLAVICRVDQTVHIIDTATGLSAYTIALTAGKDFMSGGYRSLDQCGYVFGNNWYVKFDFNPANIGTTFATILTSAATVSITTVSGCAYNPDADRFYIGSAGGTAVMSFNPTTGASSTIAAWFTNAAFVSATRISYLPAIKAVAIMGGNIFSLASVTDQYLMFTLINTGSGIARAFRGKLYLAILNGVNVYSQTSPLMKLQQNVFSTSVYTGGIAFSYALNRIYACDAYENKVAVINAANNLVLGTMTFAGLAGYGVRDVQYCPFNGQLYGQAAGEGAVGGRNRIYVFNPNSGAFGAYTGFITVGNMDDTATYYQNSMFFNSPAQ